MKLYETITAENWSPLGWGSDNFGCLLKHLSRRYLDPASCLASHIALSSAIKMLYPERAGRGGDVVTFNDHPDTTLDDVLRVCKFADV